MTGQLRIPDAETRKREIKQLRVCGRQLDLLTYRQGRLSRKLISREHDRLFWVRG